MIGENKTRLYNRTIETSSKDVLIVVDMQNDFVTGVLGTKEAQSIVPEIKKLVSSGKYQEIIYTMDTHFFDGYLDTQEGTLLPIKHCIKDTEGWEIVPELKVNAALNTRILKQSFGSTDLCTYLMNSNFKITSITLVGVCTDICVISNAIMLKSFFPDTPISVLKNCCAGVTLEKHENALKAMEACQIHILPEFKC